MSLTVLACVVVSAPARAQTPQNAIVVIIDGMRDDEGFGAESLYLRHIWNDLRPLGTVHKRFWDRGWTATTGGHTTILSGVRQILRNNGSNEQDVRSFDPLMFEYYRKHFGAPESACGVVVGKWGNVGAIADFSLEPAYGEPYQGFQRGNAFTGTDTACSRLVHRAMDSLHPRLVLVNLGDVDHYGHIDTLGGAMYRQSIPVADSIIYEFYKHIQAIPPYTDTFYRNKTLLIVTSDHGRNDDAHGGFYGHGEWDHGSRQIGFLAIGPGIAQNRIATGTARDQIDIVPTIGAALGFPVPFAEGDVMTELFSSGAPQPLHGPQGPPARLALNLSNNAGFSRDPDIARDRNGNLYCAWTDKTPGSWQVQLRKSTDAGVSWSAAQTFFNYPGADSQMWYARVAADDSLIVSGMGWGKHLNPIDAEPPSRYDTTFIWYPWLATSADAGATWSQTSLLDSGMGSYYAPATVKNGRYGVAWWAVGRFSYQVPANGILFNNRAPAGAWRASAVRPAGQQAIHLAMADDGANYHIVSSAWRASDFDLGYHRSTDGGTTWATTWLVQDTAGNPNYDYDPELVVDDSGMVHLFWARKANVGGAWRVMYGRRNPATGVFDTLQLVLSSAGAWQPHAARKGDTLMLVWVDYRDGNPEVYSRFSADRGVNWSDPERVTYTDALTHHPRVAATGRGFYCVWQDYTTGNWEVYGRELDLGQGRDVGVVRIDAPAGTLDTFANIRPRATFQNFGAMTATFKASFTIFDALGAPQYQDSVVVPDLGAGAQVTLSFPDWARPYPLGTYATRCSTDYAGDAVYTNDLAIGTFTLVPPQPGWLEKTSMPTAPSGKYAKDGAWLSWMAGKELVYAAKGYKTTDFYAFEPGADTWTTLAQVPLGTEARSGYKGAVGATDGERYVYATKGNNTQAFWRYDAETNNWLARANVPLGLSNKKVKGGTDMAFVKKDWNDYVYLLKGYKCEFYRYHTATDSWRALPDAPTGMKPKWDKGSFIVYDGDHTIYAHKAKYHELYSFNTLTDSWNPGQLKPMPRVSRLGTDRKSKDGGSGAWRNGTIYAFKGANTQEFWKYYALGDSWSEQETIPAVGSSGRKKKVKGGGDLLAVGPGVFYALKGNKVNELWRYYAPIAYRRSLPADREGVESGSRFDVRRLTLDIRPNPLTTGFATVRLSGPPDQLAAGSFVHISMYDASGRRVLSQTSNVGRQTSGVALDLRHLPAGVYLVKVDAAASSVRQKLVIER
jgi:hypothetical protein